MCDQVKGGQGYTWCVRGLSLHNKETTKDLSVTLQFTQTIKLFSVLSLILFVQFGLETILVISHSSGRIFVCVWWKSPGRFLVAHFGKEEESKPSTAWGFQHLSCLSRTGRASPAFLSLPREQPQLCPGTLSPVFMVGSHSRCAFLTNQHSSGKGCSPNHGSKGAAP